MASLAIRLAKWNDLGASAGLDDCDGAYVEVVKCKTSRNAKSICLEAAKRLRKFADDFERLAEADEPFRESTQTAVSNSQ